MRFRWLHKDRLRSVQPELRGLLTWIASVGLPLCWWASTGAAVAGQIIVWGPDNARGPAPTGHNYVQIALGENFGLALRTNGSIVGWGHAQPWILDIPEGNGFTAIAATAVNGIALRADGSLSTWGDDNSHIKTSMPTGTGFTAITGGTHVAFALRTDGSIAAWGAPIPMVANTPTDAGYTAIFSGYSVAQGEEVAFALRADGSLVAWGYEGYRVVSQAPTTGGLTAVATGSQAGYGLLADGTIVAWGEPDGRPELLDIPMGTGYQAIAAGSLTGLALRADGSIATWGAASEGLLTSTPTGAGFTAISAGKILPWAAGLQGTTSVPEPSVLLQTLVTLGSAGLWQLRRYSVRRNRRPPGE